MEEDGFISNITIGNVISRPKKSASDKKMEKKMKYLEKKQIRKQHKKKNENENNNPKRKIFNNESNKQKILIEEKKEKIFNKNVIKETEEEKEEKIIEDKHKDKEIKIENKKKEVKIVEENKKDKPIKNENKKKEEKMIEENNKDKEIKIENKKKDKELTEDNNNDNLIINESISNKNIKKEDNKKKSNTSQTIFSIKSFEDLQINPYLKKALNKNNYNIMTKIQKKAIPILLEHKNVIVKSETGSGKTLAYIIPLYQNLIEINDINKISRKDGIYSIIFSPTHELCLQIEKTLDKIKSCCINVVYGTMMGGQKVETEKKKLRKGLNIIITTPGRLLYHLKNTENLNFNKLKIIIIDEADLMLDMGFEKDIKECFKLIIKKTENEYNNVENIELNPDLFKKFKIYLISATIDNRIRKMSNYFMKGFKAIGFEKEDNDNNKKENNNEIKEDNIINHNNYLSNLKQQNITQLYSYIYDEFKLVHLIAFLYNNFQKKTIIFVSTCDLCEYLSKIITEIEININNNDKSPEKNINLFSQKTYKLHGKMKHEERKIVFNEFNLDNTGILIATDVASRGLDFQDVEWIIHYDINPDIKEYINRIGRTARIDNIGNSILFLMKNELKLLDTCFNSVKNNLNEMKNSDILINFVKNINKNILQTKIDENFSDIKIEDDVLDENEIYKKKYNSIINILIRCIKNFVFKNKNNLILARKAFKSEIRAYVTFFKYGKDVFNTNVLNLTRISRSFGLYKESTSMKVGDDQVNINYQIDRKEKYTQKKFLNKKIQNRLIYSEFE